MAKNSEQDIRKLRAQDSDTVVQNTVVNAAQKKMANLKPTERLALAGPAIDQEIELARESGQLTEEQANKTKLATTNQKAYDKTKKEGGVESTFLDALTFFAPQAIGMAIGGLFGGAEGAVSGGAQGQQLGQAFRQDQRQKELDEQDQIDRELKREQSVAGQELKKIDQELRDRSLNLKEDAAGNVKRADQILHKKTGETLFTTKKGQVVDQSGSIVPPEMQRTVVAEKISQAERRLNQGSQRVNISLANLGERVRSGDRQDARFDEAKRQKDELSDVQVSQITDLEVGLDTVSRIRELSKQVDTGPLSGRTQSLAEGFGGSSEEFTKLRAATGKQLAEFVKSISGAAVSEQEAARLSKLIPSVNDPENVFSAKLSEFERGIQKALKSKTKNLQKFQGKTVPGSKSNLDRVRAALKARRGK